MFSLRGQLMSFFAESARDCRGGHCDVLAFALELAAGHFQGCPFEEDCLGQARGIIAKYLGLGPQHVEAALGQLFRLDLIGGLLAIAGDPDAALFGKLRDGSPRVSTC